MLPSGIMITDEQLTEKVRQGDHKAFEILFERHRTPIYRFCLLMLGDRLVAEDAYQEAFIALYQSCRRKERIRSVRGFLLTVARRKCLNLLRDDYKQVALDDDIVEAYEIDIDLVGVSDLLKAALLKIPAQYREAFLLFELEGYSYKEIADCLDVNLDVVRNRIFRGKKALQKILAPTLNVEIDESKRRA